MQNQLFGFLSSPFVSPDGRLTTLGGPDISLLAHFQLVKNKRIGASPGWKFTLRMDTEHSFQIKKSLGL
jgi:hypothetical protein